VEHERDDPAAALPAAPPAAQVLFGARLELATRYAEHLADTGVGHGLIGPREVPRLWDRHLVNCALLTDLLPHNASIIDVGAGAGLPGVVVAIRRPDVAVTLVEPLLRRVTWLQDVLDDLGLEDVQVRRARAEELVGELGAPYVTARAVASLDRLVRWSAPLLVPGGQILAIKGRSAEAELAEHAAVLERWGISGDVVRLGSELVEEPTAVVRLTVPDPGLITPPASSPGRRGRARRRR
jgi:16S rRNA (guanine527-N7)-methyltransferase